jgi:hypothetical protein
MPAHRIRRGGGPGGGRLRVGRTDVHRRGPLRPQPIDPPRVRHHHLVDADHRARRLHAPGRRAGPLPRAPRRHDPAPPDPRPHGDGDRLDDRARADPARDRHPDDPGDLPHAERGGAPERAGGERARLAVVVGVPLPEARRRHGQRAPPAAEPPGGPGDGRPRRHPQLLGSPARGQARRGAGPAQPDHAHSRARRRVLGPVRGVLRRLARQHAAAGDRRGAGGVRSLGGRSEGAGARAGRRRRAGQGGLRPERVRRLSHDPRGVGRHARSRPHALRRPRALRGRAVADQCRERGGLGEGSAGAQAYLVGLK